jgi:hypothetical protein
MAEGPLFHSYAILFAFGMWFGMVRSFAAVLVLQTSGLSPAITTEYGSYSALIAQ